MMILHIWLANLLGMYAKYTWIFHGVITFSLTFLVYWLTSKILKRLHCYCEKTRHIWDDTLLMALRLPLFFLIWVFAITKFSHYVLVDLQQKTFDQPLDQIHLALNIIIVMWFFWRYIGFIEKRLLALSVSNENMDRTTVSIVGRLGHIALTVGCILILLEAFGIPLTGLVAFGGGGALVMGIAAQQLLANWFGGLMVFLDKPFKLGDWIQSPDRNIEGTVARIGWRTTKVVTLDHRAMYIPNSLFNQIIIANPQRMTHRRIDVTFGLRYDDAARIKMIVQDIEAMLHRHPNVDQREYRMVHLMNFGPSSLDINVYCFTRTIRNPGWRDVQQDILFKIMDIIGAHGAEFAFPTVTTHIPQGVALHPQR